MYQEITGFFSINGDFIFVLLILSFFALIENFFYTDNVMQCDFVVNISKNMTQFESDERLLITLFVKVVLFHKK